MREIVSVSLGSSRRDHQVEVELLGERFSLRRIGTDGRLEEAAALIRSLDGRVAAIGLGGIDIYLYAGGRRYEIPDGLRLRAEAQVTPVVDGSGIKNTLERSVIKHLSALGLLGPAVPTLMVSALDRFGMAEALAELGGPVVYGDLIFAAGIPYPIRTLTELSEISRKILPEMVKLPFHMLYPTGEEQGKTKAEFGEHYAQARVIAGDFHFIHKYLPPDLTGKGFITNTTTEADRADLRARGAAWLVTTTPVLGGRSFGTNVVEALLVAILDRSPADLTPEDYEGLWKKLHWEPDVEIWRPKATEGSPRGKVPVGQPELGKGANPT